MSPLGYVAIAWAMALACLLARRRPPVALGIGLVGLFVLVGAGILIKPGAATHLGNADVLMGTAYGRLFLILAGVTGLIVCLVGLATELPASLPAVVLAGLGGIGLGLSAADPFVALFALLATSLLVVLAAVPAAPGAPLTSADLQAVAANLRWSALAGGLAIGAVAWANPTVPAIGADRTAFGLADLAIVLAVALRFGAIPFHRPVARLTNTAPGTAIPLVLVWSPAALAVVVTWATDGNTIALLTPSGIGADLIIVGAAVSLIFGAIGAWLQDDLGHIVGYSIVQDAGFVLLGLAAGGADSGQHARTWLLILVVAKTAFATWATVIEARFRTARLPELNGWARRSPILGVALVGIAVATIGLPGLLAWQTRTALVEAAAGGPLAIILQVGGLASLAYYGRIIAAGLTRPATLSSAAQSDRLVRSEGGRAGLETARRTWSANRPPIAAGLVVVLVLLSLAVAVGGLGGPDAAGATGPLASPVGPVSPVATAPSA